jgi:FdhE protein
VAGGFLDVLFGRTPPPPPEVQATLADLDRARTEQPTLSGPITLLCDLLAALYAEPVTDPAPAAGPRGSGAPAGGRRRTMNVPVTEAAARLAAGIPLLRGEPLVRDLPAFRRRWQRVCAAVQKSGNSAAAALGEALRSGKLDAAELTAEAVAGRPGAVHARADALGLDPGLTATVLRFTLFPSLSRLAGGLAPLREGNPWAPGYCPTCGSWPLLGEYRGLDQARFLRCGVCASAWEVPRLFCPFCGCRDHRALGYFHAEGEENRRRVNTCGECRGYVKTLSTLAPLNGPQLLAADVTTLDLDLAAAARGYAVPG